MTGWDSIEDPADLWPAVVQYTLYYVGCSALAGAVLYVLDASANSGMSASVLIAATYAAAHKFVTKYHRPFNRGEQLRFAGVAFLATLLISALMFLGVGLVIVGPADLPQAATELVALATANAKVFAIALVIASLISFGLLYFSSGWSSRFLSKRLANRSQATRIEPRF